MLSKLPIHPSLVYLCGSSRHDTLVQGIESRPKAQGSRLKTQVLIQIVLGGLNKTKPPPVASTVEVEHVGFGNYVSSLFQASFCFRSNRPLSDPWGKSGSISVMPMGFPKSLSTWRLEIVLTEEILSH